MQRRYIYIFALLALSVLVGCGSGTDRNFFAECMDGVKEFESNCQDICKSHGGVNRWGLKGAHCANQPPP